MITRFKTIDVMNSEQLAGIIKAVRNQNDIDEIFKDLEDAFVDNELIDTWYCMVGVSCPEDLIGVTRLKNMGIYCENGKEAVYKMRLWAEHRVAYYV